jgi:predicted MPP superfamily phosphohydrolase
MSFDLFLRVFFIALLLISALAGRHAVRWTAAFAHANPRRLRWTAWGAWYLLNLPAIYFIIFGLRTSGNIHQTWHLWFLYPYFAWQVTALVIAAILAVKAVLTFPYRVSRWVRARRAAPRDVDIDRRMFLARSATALPAALLLTSGYGIYRAQRDFEWFEPEIKLKDWPHELEGLRIMQISDTHVGNFMPGDKLKEFIADINRKPCDLMVLTGDIINNNMAWFDECMNAFGTLKLPRYGAYVCIGNHDYYSRGAEEILQGMQKLGLTVVRDRHVQVPIGNSRLTVAGIDYPVWASHAMGSDRLKDHVDAALAERDPDLPVILLAHHPHAFDRAAEHGVALTLAGHTHGGQFAFSYPGGNTVSLGDFMFKYVAGVYEKQGSHLYVNRGLGNWFPMRLGAPPEVTRITVG